MALPPPPTDHATGDYVPWVYARKGQTLLKCFSHRHCWVCGHPLHAHEGYRASPANTLDYTFNRPPCHPTCLQYVDTWPEPEPHSIRAHWVCKNRTGFPKLFDDGIREEGTDGKTRVYSRFVTPLPSTISWLYRLPDGSDRPATAAEVEKAIVNHAHEQIALAPSLELREGLEDALDLALTFFVPR